MPQGSLANPRAREMIMRRIAYTCAAAMWVCFATPASAALVISTYTGTVTSGYDETGEFGTAHTNLGGNYVAKFTYDTARGTPFLVAGQQDARLGGTSFSAPSPILSATLTINGFTHAFASDYEGIVGVLNTPFISDSHFYAGTAASSEHFGSLNDSGGLKMQLSNSTAPISLLSAFSGNSDDTGLSYGSFHILNTSIKNGVLTADHAAFGNLDVSSVNITPLSDTTFSAHGGGLPGYDTGYGLHYDGSSFTVSMNISTGFSLLPPGVVDQWTNGIEDIWGHHMVSTPFGEVPLNFDVSFNDNSRPYDANIGVSVLPFGCKANALEWCVFPVVDDAGHVDATRAPWMAAHEFGHLVGLYDEYVGGGNDPAASSDDLCRYVTGTDGYPTPVGTFCHSLMADGVSYPSDRNYDRILQLISENAGFPVELGNLPLDHTFPQPSVGRDFRGIVEGGGVPEPSTWSLILLAFAMTGSALRRSKQRSSARIARKRPLWLGVSFGT
jgi:hypothetical protein